MKFYQYSLLLLYFSLCLSTFSIVAVDTNTNEIGSAGGSCIANSIIISDMHPGQGVIHTQSYWTSANQIYASQLMEQGFSPDDIIELLQINDSQNNPSIRQYGIVDINYSNIVIDDLNKKNITIRQKMCEGIYSETTCHF